MVLLASTGAIAMGPLWIFTVHLPLFYLAFMPVTGFLLATTQSMSIHHGVVLDERQQAVSDQAHRRAHLGSIALLFPALVIALPLVAAGEVSAFALLAAGTLVTLVVMLLPAYVLAWTMPAEAPDLEPVS